MAASLEDLLVEDGFKGRKSFSRSRTSFRSEKSPSMPTYHVQQQVKKDFVRTTQRSRSDVARYSYNKRVESPRIDGVRARDNLVGRFGARESITSHSNNEIVEVQDEDEDEENDIFSDEVKGKKVFEKIQSKKLSHEKVALDEVAIQAMVSILSGYIKRFLKEKEFRVMIRGSCLSILDFLERKRGETESRVISTLEEAIDTIEKSVEESSMSTKDMKKVVMQLSVLVGMNTNDNIKKVLSSCAHLYLSVIYKFQKKDRVAAKHVLQVFCDSPSHARTELLPELWDYLFSPHLSHLKIWYNQEANSLLDTQEKPRKLKLLDKMYNELVDSGTYQFAIYYKDWLTEGVETTPVPSILAPVLVSESQKGNSSEMSSSPNSNPFSPQPMVSKTLYNAMFRRASKAVSEDLEIENSDDSPVVKHTLTEVSNSTNANICLKLFYLENLVLVFDIVMTLFRIKENELITLKRLAKSVFEPDNNTIDFATIIPLTNIINEKHDSSEGYRMTISILIYFRVFSFLSTKRTLIFLYSIFPLNFDTKISQNIFIFFIEFYGDVVEEKSSSSLPSIPEDFICPLTRRIFENPTSIETGHTFEQKAIKAWFDQGNKTCPTTGKVLECNEVPSTNLILKRVIESWKTQHCRHLFALASQVIENSGTKQEIETTLLILEQLFTNFGEEERTNNAKRLISIGGLQFLMHQLEYGSLETKTCLIKLLSCCIEVESRCRNQIARDISKKCLLELLHCKDIKARESAVLLIIELICLKRKKDVIEFLSGLENENGGLEDTMHIILLYLHISPPFQRPLVAVVLLYLDLLVEPSSKYSIYREEAVDALTNALDHSLADEKIRENCCRALLMLGGQFSSSGKLMTETWILNQAGYFKGNQPENDEDNSLVDDTYCVVHFHLTEDEEEKNEEWLGKMCTSLVGNGRRSFLEGISKCVVRSKDMEELVLVRVCLITVTWLSFSLSSSISNSELQISAFSLLISILKQTLENGLKIEHKILASSSLLSFTKMPECRVLLMSMAENITGPLPSLAEETWTAKMLYAIISGHEL
ncbi:putative E3 ubiquitin-protein ligase LIN-2 [Cannabis sativa]|uniref:putative E3 ubiquitin-protein ligase LIN-2 n=1 Tax=Cannabis sativa TaxID=3483 RepID=UPI0029CA893D|nr:putative E3 ubiquitin-protein ligase LIN-2 [Cannabis sativa]